ncbi:unnamed protein product [Urochloa decumbens]|uniref:F-box domain-containing protein n=1 Tax=Urochloa decumbens TaxID=240449 RepID=A0ABC9CXC9_9POAL
MEQAAASRQRGAAADRLSDLPDIVLLEILSRLTFRQAVRTGALSRRWRSLWHDVPYPPSCIGIDDGSLFVSGGDTDHAVTEERCDDRGAEDESLPLGAFRARISDHNFEMAYGSICRALPRRPMAVAVRCDASDPHFPKRPEFSFALYGGASTRHLRALQLHGVSLDRRFAGVIADELPVLGDLQLGECTCSFARIASTSLQNLAIDDCDYKVEALVLAAPRIAFLRVHGAAPPVASESAMPSLVAASLEQPASVFGLLKSLRHARSLTLLGLGTTGLLDDEKPRGFPVFRDLSALVLDECDVGVRCQVLRRFLRNCPGLETLALRYCSFTGGSGSSDDRKRRYACKKLKSVELEYHYHQDVSELDDALEEIPRKVVRPIKSSVHDGIRTVRITYE